MKYVEELICQQHFNSTLSYVLCYDYYHMTKQNTVESVR